jgi:hypothetical protein
MKHLLFLSLPLLLIIISCSENGPIEPTTYTDAELKEKIIGIWTTDYVTLSFDENGNFTKYTDYNYTNGDTIINETDDIKGTYDIVNGVLMYTSITEWIQNQSFLGGGHILPNYKIIMGLNYLYLNSFERLVRIGDDEDSIWGKWYTYAWSHKYSDPQVFGDYEKTYNFNKDSMTVTIGTWISYDSIQTYPYYTQQLTYNPPEISWYGSITRIIEFHDNQIWMYYKSSQPPIPFKKQN